MTRKKDPRTARLPVPAGELPPFTPVPRQYVRHDGWTPERQIAFIEALADTGSVEAACKAVDMSQAGAYNLRRQPGAECFRKAWQAALGLDVALVEDVVMDRAHNSFEEPLYSYGRLIGTRRRYNDRLLMFILRNRSPERFAAGGAPKGLNAVSQMQIDRLEKQWRKAYEAQRRKVSPEEVRGSIDKKIEEIRRRIEKEKAAQWAKLSEETREAWAHFITLRDRDLAAMDADAKTREILSPEWDARSDLFDPPETPLLPAPSARKSDDGLNEDWQRPPPGWVARRPPPPLKTSWTIKDDSFDP